MRHAAVTACALLLFGSAVASAGDADRLTFFRDRVRPLLRRCPLSQR